MRDENTYSRELAVSQRIINNLPRYGLCQRSARPFQQVEEEASSDEESAEGETDHPAQQTLPDSKLALALRRNFETALLD